jgi:hypothetical protein
LTLQSIRFSKRWANDSLPTWRPHRSPKPSRWRNVAWTKRGRKSVAIIECFAQFGYATELWKTWAIPADIKTDTGNLAAAVEAKRKAIACHLAHHRDDSENHDAKGHLALAVTQILGAGDPAEAATLLQQLAADPDVPGHAQTFIRTLQAIVVGSRDRTLADTPELTRHGCRNPVPDRNAGEVRIAFQEITLRFGIQFIDFGGHDKVVFVQAADLVGIEQDAGVAPTESDVGMMPLLFGQIAHSVDERQGSSEVFERESAFDPRAILQQLPTGRLR